MLYFLQLLPPSLIFKSTSAQSNDTVRIVAVKRCVGQDVGRTFSRGGNTARGKLGKNHSESLLCSRYILIVSVRGSETTGNLLIVNHPFISESVLQAEVAVVRKCQRGGGIFSVEGLGRRG